MLFIRFRVEIKDKAARLIALSCESIKIGVRARLWEGDRGDRYSGEGLNDNKPHQCKFGDLRIKQHPKLRNVGRKKRSDALSHANCFPWHGSGMPALRCAKRRRGTHEASLCRRSSNRRLCNTTTTTTTTTTFSEIIV